METCACPPLVEAGDSAIRRRCYNSMKKTLSIIMSAAECTPFAKVGGLADVIGSLPQALASTGVAVTVILPRYGSINKKKFGLKKIGSVLIPTNRKKERITVYEGTLRHNAVRYLFIDHRYFTSKEVYVPNKGKTKPDIERFSFFSQAVVETISTLKLPCDILHCHDWHTALIPSILDNQGIVLDRPFIPTILTIHNLVSQGTTNRAFIKRLGFKKNVPLPVLEDFYDLDGEQLNFMKIGILSADPVTTVSPHYSMEIMGSEFGAGLETFLTRRKKDLSGIINGIDSKDFNPAIDAHLISRYTVPSVQKGKKRNKDALLTSLKLSPTTGPLIGVVTRLVAQKGLDIAITALDSLLAQNDARIIILGTGDPVIEQACRKLATRYPTKVAALIRFDETLARRIYAANDLFLMPSYFEPCGLGQMIAMRYGTIPLVRDVGGLHDTVIDNKTGFVFNDYTAAALSKALDRALTLYTDKKAWYTMVNRCMQQDFSWAASASKYKKLYDELA